MSVASSSQGRNPGLESANTFGVFGCDLNQSPQTNAPLHIPSSASFDIRCEEFYSSIKQFMEGKKAIQDINQIELEIGWIMFEDRTAWAAGNFYKPDPSNPNRYINVGDKPSN